MSAFLSLLLNSQPGESQQLLVQGAAALLTCVPLCISFLSAGLVQPHNPANKLTKIQFAEPIFCSFVEISI